MLDIRLLGNPVITVDGEPISVDTRKATAMIAFLVIEGGSADRDTLADLLWGESPADRARATLRRTLSVLRAGIGPERLRTNRDRIELLPGYRCDLELFESAVDTTLAHGHDAQDVCPRCVDPLSAAADLYRGDFLGSFYVRDAPEFEHWARTVAESARSRASEVFSRLALASAMTGDYAKAIATTNRWIGLDELHEPAHRMAMLLGAWTGDRPGAIQAYRRCVAILDRELGVPPLEETTDLYEAILAEDLPPAPGARPTLPKTAPSPAATPPRSGTMLDRDSERQALATALETGRGSGKVVLITGDSWMGKTRLLEELAAMTEEEGRPMVTAKGFRTEGSLPYGVAIQLVRGLVEVLEGREKALPEWAREELSRIEPGLGSGVTPETPERLGVLRLHEAFVALLECSASASPLVVAIDDLQWSDPASASMLAHSVRRVGGLPLLLVVTSRSHTELGETLREALADGSEIIALQSLTPSDLGDRPDAGALIQETGGIPLLVQEAIERGDTGPDISSVARYMESRRSRLSDLGNQVLAASAVLSGISEASLLRDTSGRTDDEIVDAVEELISAGLLVEEPGGKLGFVLEAMETVVYDTTSLTRRRLLHRRAAEAIAARPRARHDPRLATAVAGHLRSAGSEEAAEWFRIAGDLAREVFAYDEAARSYETAIALGHPEVGRLHLALGELAMARGDYRTAAVELRSAAAQCTGSDLAVVEHRTGDLNRLLGRFDLAEQCFGRARDAHPDPAALNADWAILRHRVGDLDSATRLATESLATAEKRGDERAVARALTMLAMVEPDPAVAMTHVQSALRSAGNDPLPRMSGLNVEATLLAADGAVEEAKARVEEAIDLAGRTGYRHQKAALLDHLADLHHQDGDDQAAEKAQTEAVSLFADVAAGEWEPEVWLLRVW